MAQVLSNTRPGRWRVLHYHASSRAQPGSCAASLVFALSSAKAENEIKLEAQALEKSAIYKYRSATRRVAEYSAAAKI